MTMIHGSHSTLLPTCCVALAAMTTAFAPLALADDSHPGHTKPGVRSSHFSDSALSPTEARRMSDMLKQKDVNLAEAIETAESHCEGKAIDARCRARGGDTLVFDVTCLDKSGRMTVVCVDASGDKVLDSAAMGAANAGSYSIMKASEMDGRNITNAAGDKIADVETLAIDTTRGRVAYVILDLTGGIDKLVTVPWSSLKHREDTCVLDLGGRTLDKAPGMRRDTWPDMTTAEFNRQMSEYYGTRPYGEDVPLKSGTSTTIVNADEIIGGDVHNPAGEDLGEIEDLVVAADSGRIAYAVLSFGGILGFGDKLFAVPMTALTREADGDWVLPVEKEKLKHAPGFNKDNWPNFADPGLDVTLREFYTSK